MDLFEKGDSIIEEDQVDTWLTAFEPPYREFAADGRLGFKGGFGHGIVPIWSLSNKGKRQAAAVYKWEAVARWLIPKGYDGGNPPKWQSTASEVIVKRIHEGKETLVVSIPGIADGPTGHWSGRTPDQKPCTIVKQYAWDAPRYHEDPEKGAGYYFSGKFELKISDQENAWATKFWISFFFEDSEPGGGTGQLTVIEPPHEISK